MTQPIRVLRKSHIWQASGLIMKIMDRVETLLVRLVRRMTLGLDVLGKSLYAFEKTPTTPLRKSLF